MKVLIVKIGKDWSLDKYTNKIGNSMKELQFLV
jgi:hypothetical protein